jgi:hypothetical protein
MDNRHQISLVVQGDLLDSRTAFFIIKYGIKMSVTPARGEIA